MNSDPEDDFLDTELRNVFHDYQLPPTEHLNVWAGVEARIASLPVLRPGLPSQLLWPLTAAVLGVAVGWLLPHPAAQPELPPPTWAAPRAERAAAPAPLLSPATWAAAVTPAAATPTRALAKESLPAKAQSQLETKLITRPITKLRTTRRASPTAPTAEAATQIAAQPATVTDSLETTSGTAATVASATPLAAETNNVPAVSLNSPMPVQNPLASPMPMAERPAKVLKPNGFSEKIGYHKPSNRQSEQGRGLRRWFSHLTQTLRHVVNL